MLEKSTGSGARSAGEEPHFPTHYSWIVQVEGFLGSREGRELAREHGLDVRAVLVIAVEEALRADVDGRSHLCREVLAQLTGYPRRTVSLARLVLMEGGLQSLVADPLRRDVAHRILQRPPSRPMLDAPAISMTINSTVRFAPAD